MAKGEKKKEKKKEEEEREKKWLGEISRTCARRSCRKCRGEPRKGMNKIHPGALSLRSAATAEIAAPGVANGGVNGIRPVL